MALAFVYQHRLLSNSLYQLIQSSELYLKCIVCIRIQKGGLSPQQRFFETIEVSAAAQLLLIRTEKEKPLRQLLFGLVEKVLVSIFDVFISAYRIQ